MVATEAAGTVYRETMKGMLTPEQEAHLKRLEKTKREMQEGIREARQESPGTVVGPARRDDEG
jgi:Spy/CpxP family protein refolding chaperone